MADHPLRPATDRRLGGPLPHLLANRTRTPPSATGPKVPIFHLSTAVNKQYAVLARLSAGYPPLRGRSFTRYSPVRHSTQYPKVPFSFDLHVLSTPPAFILSQDQTLKFNLYKTKKRYSRKAPQKTNDSLIAVSASFPLSSCQRPRTTVSGLPAARLLSCEHLLCNVLRITL